MTALNLLSTAIAAYLTVVFQIGVLGNWPLLGGQPHLIALGSVIFLLTNRPKLGLYWILVGGVLVDLLLPIRFGFTLLPLLIAYGCVSVLLRSTFEAASWWSGLIVGIVLVFCTELPITIFTGNWHQLGFDLLAASIIMLPISTTLATKLTARRLDVSF